MGHLLAMAVLLAAAALGRAYGVWWVELVGAVWATVAGVDGLGCWWDREMGRRGR